MRNEMEIFHNNPPENYRGGVIETDYLAALSVSHIAKPLFSVSVHMAK